MLLPFCCTRPRTMICYGSGTRIIQSDILTKQAVFGTVPQ